MNITALHHLESISKILIFGIVMVFYGIAAGEELEKPVDPAVENAVKELTQAYGKLDGYIVTYIAISGEKSAECTIALDIKSQLQSCDITGQGMQMRHWTTENDEYFFTSDNETSVFRGLNKQLIGVSQIFNLLRKDKLDKKTQIVINFILSKENMETGVKLTSNTLPAWTEFMTHASIDSSDQESVTFKTPDRGLIKVDRKSGIMIHQTLGTDKNPNRSIEMKKIQLNPGKEAIKKIIAGWPATDAKEEAVIAQMAPMWKELFEYIIAFSETKKINTEELDKVLKEEYEVLRAFSRACIEQTPSAISARINWADLLDKMKVSARDSWRELNPRFENDPEKAFEEFFQTPAVRLQIRNKVIDLLIEDAEFSTHVMNEIFGAGYWQSLNAKTNDGTQNKKLLGNAFTRAYFEVILDQKMASYWDQDEDID